MELSVVPSQGASTDDAVETDKINEVPENIKVHHNELEFEREEQECTTNTLFMKDAVVEEEKEMWRQIFFSLSAGIALKKTPTYMEYQRSKSMADGENPEIDLKRLVNFLHTRDISSKKLEEQTGLPRHQLAYMASSLAHKGDKNKDGKISLEEWEDWIQSKSGKEFLSRHKYADGFMRVMAYSPQYNCRPPTLFILTMSILQVLFYLLSLFAPETLGMPKLDSSQTINMNNRNEVQHLQCSFLIVDPVRRKEVWRFFTYMFLHANHQHIGYNLLMQLLIGIPLEMGQPGWTGSLRIAALYMSGVLLGSVGASCIQPQMFLVGASAGVYSLIAAHLATLILNWNEDGMIYRKKAGYKEAVANNKDSIKQNANAIQVNKMVAPSHLNPYIRGLRLAFVLLFCFLDIGYALYLNFVKNLSSTTSYAGHANGAVAGLLIGVFILKNRKVDDWEIIVQSVAFVLYGLLFCMFVAWQIAGTPTVWFPISQNTTQHSVTKEILKYCKTCYNETYVENFQECPDFW